MRFPKNNNIVFGQYMSWWVGIPSDVDFDIDEIHPDGKIWLSGSRYGGTPFGNGKIVIYLKTLEHLKIPT